MRWDLGCGAGLVTAYDGVVVAVLPDDEVELGAERLGELDATQLEATHPGGHFVGIEREEDVAELLDFALLVGTGAATLEAVQLLVIEVLDALADGSQQAVGLAGQVVATAALSVG